LKTLPYMLHGRFRASGQPAIPFFFRKNRGASFYGAYVERVLAFLIGDGAGGLAGRLAGGLALAAAALGRAVLQNRCI